MLSISLIKEALVLTKFLLGDITLPLAGHEALLCRTIQRATLLVMKCLCIQTALNHTQYYFTVTLWISMKHPQ